jgi:hypothetical protein
VIWKGPVVYGRSPTKQKNFVTSDADPRLQTDGQTQSSHEAFPFYLAENT